MGLDFLAQTRSESARFIDVLRNLDPNTRVPPCPDWTAADLLWHLGEVQHFWATIVRDRLTDLETYVEPERPEGYAALLDYFAGASAALISALDETADDVHVWTWFDADQSVGFVRRRQAHEALIHRLDAELAAGAVTVLDPELATDGILEAIVWMFGGAPTWADKNPEGPIGRLATTDTKASWLIQMGSWGGISPNTGKTYTDETMLSVVAKGKPTFEITGTANDLDAWIWNRAPLDSITRSGDTAAIEALITSGVQ